MDREELFVGVRDAREGAGRIRAIVRDLATFSRGNEPEAVRPVDVNRALEFSLKMAERQVTARARLTRRLGQLPPVLGVESRLSQVFLNLLVNAAQSIPEGDAARHEVRVSTEYDPNSGRVTVEIADTGRGIAPEDQAHLRPFSPPVGAAAGSPLPRHRHSLGGGSRCRALQRRHRHAGVLPAAERQPTGEPARGRGWWWTTSRWSGQWCSSSSTRARGPSMTRRARRWRCSTPGRASTSSCATWSCRR
jgi:hypothetical protein